jgi:hypothetical protein
MGSTRLEIEERIDVEALLESIGSLQDLRFRQRGLEPAMQQVVDAAKGPVPERRGRADATATRDNLGAARATPHGSWALGACWLLNRLPAWSWWPTEPK